MNQQQFYFQTARIIAKVVTANYIHLNLLGKPSGRDSDYRLGVSESLIIITSPFLSVYFSNFILLVAVAFHEINVIGNIVIVINILYNCRVLQRNF